MATAARTTIAEVRAFADAPLPHTEIQLPGVFVRRVVAVGDAR
jgi:acyl CoA:acetate/3-ketoacid CoA transferase alpha subunit